MAILSEQTNQLFININKKHTQHISEVAEVTITTSKEKKKSKFDFQTLFGKPPPFSILYKLCSVTHLNSYALYSNSS